MSSQKIFLFDFDGVIVDGMHEYWHSSLLACEKYLNSPYICFNPKLYKRVPNTFKEIRPWVKYGWEMVLIVHEIIKKENSIKASNKDDFIDKYNQNCQRILKDNSWRAQDLQKILDKSRKHQIDKDFETWVNLHNPFLEVINFMEKLKKNKIKTGITNGTISIKKKKLTIKKIGDEKKCLTFRWVLVPMGGKKSGKIIDDNDYTYCPNKGFTKLVSRK